MNDQHSFVRTNVPEVYSRHAHSYVLLVRLVAGATVATTKFGMRWAQATFGLRPFASDAQQNFGLRPI